MIVLGATVVGLQAGTSRQLQVGDKSIRTAIAKSAISGSARIGLDGIEGDAQADRRTHGGKERALGAYPAVHLLWWGDRMRRHLDPGAFGENLTIMGLDERRAHIGDRFRFGSALLEISQPREPAPDLAAWLGTPDLTSQIRENGRTGWYFRVIEPGIAAAGLPLVQEVADSRKISVVEAYRIRLDTRGPRDQVRRLLEVPALSSGWRISLQRRL
ncbi:MAG: MOSC domain-containing protein [Gemmatimonadota bacterium]